MPLPQLPLHPCQKQWHPPHRTPPAPLQCESDEFTEQALSQLASKGQQLEWGVCDPATGRTPLMQAALHGNLFLVRRVVQALGKVRVGCGKGGRARCHR